MKDISQEKKVEILNAKRLVAEYKEIEKKISELKLKDIKDKSNLHSNEIAKLNLKLISMRPEVDEMVDRAALIMGIKTSKGVNKYE